MRQSMPNNHPAYSSHSRNLSTTSNTAPSMMMMTPPMSPPSAPITTTTAATAVSNMGPPPPRYPIPAHLNLSPMSPPYSRPVIAPNPRAINSTIQEETSFNPYAYQIPENGSQNPPEYAYHNHSFDIASDPASPVFPPLHPAFPLAGGDESLFDRWLRHEAMGGAIFPASRTGSSIATSDISSVRGGMFGSLPGGRAADDRATEGGSRAGPGSVVSAATRDNFTTSAPSYPSSRTGGTRPNSRDGDVRSVTGESYAPSVVSSDIYPPSIDTRMRMQQNAPPTAPTPPTSSMASGSAYEPSMFERDEASMDSGLPNSPMPAATRPPRYSAATDGAIYRSYLAQLIQNGAVAYPSPATEFGGPSINEKIALANSLNNLQTQEQQFGPGVVVVQEEVWQELRRLAGLDGMTMTPQPSSSSNGVITPSLPSSSRRSSGDVLQEKKRRSRGEKEAGCCGSCIIC